MDAKRKSWPGNVQYMRTPCNLASIGGHASYSLDDQPFVQFANVIDNHARCVAHDRDLKDFETAIDRFAQPLSAAFSGQDWRRSGAAHELWPTEAVATRGSIADTFGMIGMPAAVDQGQTLALVVPVGVAADARVSPATRCPFSLGMPPTIGGMAKAPSRITTSPSPTRSGQSRRSVGDAFRSGASSRAIRRSPRP
jgi:hypothetical protein